MIDKLRWFLEKILTKSKIGDALETVISKLARIKKYDYIKNDREQLALVHPKKEISCIVPEKEFQHKYNLQIVIPMYNAEQYIDECITSILSQRTTYTYKVVLVDDGSQDRTKEVVVKYSNDERVQIIEQQNAGAAVARNTGLRELCADYVMFVDIDDKLKEGAIELLLQRAYKKNADIVEGSYEIFSEKSVTHICHTDECTSEACGRLWGFPWGKVISSELFKNVRFPEGYWYEDTIISYLVHTRSVKSITTDSIVYSYRKNPKGFSHIKGKNPKLLDSYWIYEIMLEDMFKFGIEISQSIFEQFLESVKTGSKRIMYMDTEIRKMVLSLYSRMLNQTFAQFSTQKKHMECFEQAVRNNHYDVYKWLLIVLK